jgi:2,7-dihydroxy-5-methyl-1-naphthoate 7-O-methyltransferase
MADELYAAADLLTPMAIRVAATLRLADHIAAGTRTAGALAEAVGAAPDALERLLHHLIGAGVLTGDLALTALGDQLRDDHPDGLRTWLDMDGALGRADLSFVELLHTVRTGEPTYPARFGRPFWEDMAADPARQASFDALMGGRLTADLPGVAAGYPWAALGHVVDVGGGDGSLLIALLRAHDTLRGTVVDLPATASRARAAFTAAGLAGRATAEAGSFFDALPAGAGGYVLSGILHDWDDDAATRILRRCAEAAGDTGRVLLVDHFRGAGVYADSDLRMLCYVGGRERSLDQVGALAAAAGLHVGPARPGGSRSIVELLPDPGPAADRARAGLSPGRPPDADGSPPARPPARR